MSPARRSRRRQDWPRGLYEPRPGYFVWRHPETRKTFALGSIPLSHAKHQALQANAHVLASQPTLLAKLTGATNTVADLLAAMEVATAKNTARAHRSMDKLIRAKLGEKACSTLSVADCARVIEEIEAMGKMRWAQAIRSRLVAMCQRGQQKGWMTSNPAEVTRKATVVVKRQRLTLEQFRAIFEKAPQVSEWLQDAMLLALVTGQDRSTVAKMSRADVQGDVLISERTKTGVKIAIPLDLRMDVMGVSLRDLVSKPAKVVTRLLVHHAIPHGNAPVGSKVHPDRITHAFTTARQLAGIPDDGAPTFHEIRSLSKRLYEEQGGVDTKALLGHLTERMSALYADTRGLEPIKVRVA